MWKRVRRQYGFSRSNVPARIRIAKQLLIALEQEEAIEQGDEESNQRQVWYDVQTNGSAGGAARQRLRLAGKSSQGYATNGPHISRPNARSNLLSVRANARQVLRDARIQADDSL